jgi:hypothetical protein
MNLLKRRLEDSTADRDTVMTRRDIELCHSVTLVIQICEGEWVSEWDTDMENWTANESQRMRVKDGE